MGAMNDAGLFNVAPVVPEPAEKLSGDRRRTRRQAEALAHGRHPLGLVLGCTIRLHPDAAPAGDRTAPGLRCGSCRFRELLPYHSRPFPKCTVGHIEGRANPRITHGVGTDIRRWWPACRDYEPREATS